MAYNFTNITNANGSLLDVMVAVNSDLTNGWFFVMATVALFVVIMMALSNFGLMRALASASFVTGLTGVLMSITGLISGDFLIYYLIFMSLVGAALFVWSQQGGT